MTRQNNKFYNNDLIKNIEDNMKTHKSNKELFEESSECFTKCPRYNPCPICGKCQNKASHLYYKCEMCEIPMCTHKYKDRENMIKRKNNTIYVTRETINKLKAIEDKNKKVIKNEFNCR